MVIFLVANLPSADLSIFHFSICLIIFAKQISSNKWFFFVRQSARPPPPLQESAWWGIDRDIIHIYIYICVFIYMACIYIYIYMCMTCSVCDSNQRGYDWEMQHFRRSARLWRNQPGVSFSFICVHMYHVYAIYSAYLFDDVERFSIFSCLIFCQLRINQITSSKAPGWLHFKFD